MVRFVQRRDLWVIALAGASTLTACTEGVRLGRDLAVSGASGPEAGAPAASGATGVSGASGSNEPGAEFPLGGAGGSAGDAAPAALADAGPCTPLPCGGSVRKCGDCVDPECLGPCDDSESELQSGNAVNVTGSCHADCYFDRNTGSGDDSCSWSYNCDPLSVAPAFDPTGRQMCEHDPGLASCDGSELGPCLDSCLPLTPNGCDCFGCCELPAASGHFIWLGAASERPCTPVPGCQNPCDECELCVGKPELPASCSGALGPRCPEGVQSCDPETLSGCGSLEYCITGCCVPLPT
jgi:hypothetical protein